MKTRLRQFGGAVTWVAVLLCWFSLRLAVQAAVSTVDSIVMVVGDLDRSTAFYTRVLDFAVESSGSGSATEVGLRTGGVSRRLRLGDDTLILCAYPDVPGRPIPSDSRSQDHWFQHVAIVVSDMDRAYAHLRRHGVRHVSTGPQTLPVWNPQAAGIRAFYFRDPEEHVLEVIEFPPGKGRRSWHRSFRDVGGDDRLFLGIDHTAMVVADTGRSLRFYQEAMGLELAGESENWGTEQEHLNQVFGARVRITSLRATSGPGVELLEYLAPPGGRPLPADARIQDQLAWRILVHIRPGENPGFPADVSRWGGRVLGGVPGGGKDEKSGGVLRDPDGHLIEWVQGESAP